MQHVRHKRRFKIPPIGLIITFLILISTVLFSYNMLWSTDRYQAKKVVVEFYELEQNGNYGGAWELLHSSMQAKFSKDIFIQKRAQVFMQQWGATTFEFDVGKMYRLGAWGSAETALANVQRTHVTQHMLTIFGVLNLSQDIYVAKENNQWKLFWSSGEEEA